ncbi:MAG: adenylyltransferase/cytidyltransferase family protein [bacterium]|nr:adenylyltransferase/cytidyltransferase family protein [bacterium]
MQGSAHRDLGSKPVRQARTKTVYVIGVFDLFHRGHLAFLEHARALGSRLVVAINGDAMVASYKRKPFHSEQDRLTIVRALRCVDEAFVIHGYDNRRPMLEHEVDIVVHGNDWEADSYMEQIRVDSAFLERHRIELCFIPYTDGVSTSSIIETIRRSPS